MHGPRSQWGQRPFDRWPGCRLQPSAHFGPADANGPRGHSFAEVRTRSRATQVLSGHPSDSWTRAAGRQGRLGVVFYNLNKVRIFLVAKLTNPSGSLPSRDSRCLQEAPAFPHSFLTASVPRFRNPTKQNFEGSPLCKCLYEVGVSLFAHRYI